VTGVRAEFTTEPFHGEDGQLPGHVTAAAEALRAAGLAPELGPLGTSVTGDSAAVVPALANALRAALDNGATRVTLQLEQSDGIEQSDRMGHSGGAGQSADSDG
jgi:uncharacterized protein YqgV (UPF0045/DUF77 family)